MFLTQCKIVTIHMYYMQLHYTKTTILCVAWWLSSKALDLRFTGRRFNSRLVRFQVT